MYKKKLQNEATGVRPPHSLLLTAAALRLPHFVLSDYIGAFLRYPSINKARHPALSALFHTLFAYTISGSVCTTISSAESNLSETRITDETAVTYSTTNDAIEIVTICP